jgi:serine acetyltransferase
MLSLIYKFIRRYKKFGLRAAVGDTLWYMKTHLLINPKKSLKRRMLFSTSCDIMIQLPPTTQIPHPVGIVIGKEVEIGDDVRIYQNVTLGANYGDEQPTIGHDVAIGTGAAVLGDVHVGDGAVIGANSVVLEDVPKNTTVAGAPAVKINNLTS